MNVLVIPEDFRRDQYILKPLFSRLFRTLGRPRVTIEVCRDPLLGGVDEALKPHRILEIVRQHGGMTDIFVLCIDRDGFAGRRQRLDEIEARVQSEFEGAYVFVAENAWEEIETWILAGLELPKSWRWIDVRAEVHVKERYFDVLARERGLTYGPGEWRTTLGQEAARRIDAIRQKCPDDFDALARRLEAIIHGN